MTTTAITLTDAEAQENDVVDAGPTVAAENTITIKLGCRPRTVEFKNAQAWNYRSAPGGTSYPVDAGQPIKLQFKVDSSIYVTRQSADGALVGLVVA